MISIHELRDLSPYTTEQLEAERDDAIVSISGIKTKILNLPRDIEPRKKMSLLLAKLAYGTVHQITSSELGRRRRAKRQERMKVVEAAFVTLAKQRLPDDVFQDLLDEAVEKTREG